MDYKYALGKKFVDPDDLKKTRLDLGSINIDNLHRIAQAIVDSSDMDSHDGDTIEAVAHVLYRVKHDLDVVDVKSINIQG
jgi:hypothetical protein